MNNPRSGGRGRGYGGVSLQVLVAASSRLVICDLNRVACIARFCLAGYGGGQNRDQAGEGHFHTGSALKLSHARLQTRNCVREHRLLVYTTTRKSHQSSQ